MDLLRMLVPFILVASYGANPPWDYCDENAEPICEDSKHFMCDPDQVPQKGVLVALHEMTPELRGHLLYRHNKIRNMVAQGGNQVGAIQFPAADHMMELAWDKELEYLAGEHARRCNMKHDQCHNTKRWLLSGQNLAYKASTNEFSAMESIDDSMDQFFEESDLFNDVADIDSLSENVIPKVGHFTVIINDNVKHVGCAIANCKKCGQNEDFDFCNHLTCNYDYTNIPGESIYKRKTGSVSSKKCVEIPEFPGLCKNEDILRELDTAESDPQNAATTVEPKKNLGTTITNFSSPFIVYLALYLNCALYA